MNVLPDLSNLRMFFLDIPKIFDKVKEIRGFEMLTSDTDVIVRERAGGWVSGKWFIVSQPSPLNHVRWCLPKSRHGNLGNDRISASNYRNVGQKARFIQKWNEHYNRLEEEKNFIQSCCCYIYEYLFCIHFRTCYVFAQNTFFFLSNCTACANAKDFRMI